MAKNKRGGAAPPKSKSEDSVRSKIINIEGGLGELTSALQAQNNNYISLIESSNFGNEIMLKLLSPINANIRSMTQAMLGLDLTDSKGQKVGIETGVRLNGASAGANKEQTSELQKETDKDNKRGDEQLAADKEQVKLLKEIHKSMQKGGVLDLILGGAMALAGFISGFVGEYIRLFKKILSPLTNLFGEGKGLTTLIEKFKVGWTKFGSYIDDIIKGVLENKYIGKIVGVFKNGWTTFVEYFKGIATLFQDVASFWTKLFGGGGAGGFFKNIMTWFQAIGERLGWFFKLGQGLGSILGKIAIPIQVIMSIWDTVSGALDGWEKTEGTFFDKLIGAVKGGLTGLLNGLVGGLLDLLKGALSWVLEFFGAKDAAAWLDSFSFTDIITQVIDKTIDAIIGFFKDVASFPMALVENFKALMDGKINWSDLLKNVLSSLITTILAPVQGMASTVGFDITKKALDLLGLPPAGSAAVSAKTSETGTPTKALQNTTTENTAVNAEKDAKAATAAAAASMSNNSSQTVNNSTTQAAIIRSKATNWDPEDQFARGMAWGA